MNTKSASNHTSFNILQQIDHYNHLIDINGDNRAKSFPLMDSYTPTAIIMISYLISLKLGMIWISNRKQGGFSLRTPMILYNFAMVIWYTYLTLSFYFCGFNRYKFLGCEPVEQGWQGKPMCIVRMGVYYYYTKLAEFGDTYFFILRNKFHLVTFLHVFHHTAVPATYWFGARISPGGSGGYFVFLNCIVHIIMYIYYGIAALGPKYQSWLWWKQYMTVIQMIQFVLLMIQAGQFFFIPCDYPFIFMAAIFFYAVVFFILFGNFFIQTYWRNSRAKLHANKKQPKVMMTNGDGIHMKNGNLVMSNGGKKYQ